MMTRILLIDDDSFTLQFFRCILAPLGYEIIEALSGSEGIEIHRKAPVDLIITDIFMPEMDGFETILALRRESPELKIIAVSSGGIFLSELSPLFLQVADGFGADRILEKPVQQKSLINAVQELID